MANKESKEFVILPAKLIDSTYQSLADGDFSILTDATNYIDDFISIQPAVQGFGEIRTENETMTVQEAEEIRDVISASMPNVDPQDRRDLTAGLDGVLSIFRLAWRRGAEKATKETIKKVKSGEIDLSQFDGNGESLA